MIVHMPGSRKAEVFGANDIIKNPHRLLKLYYSDIKD
jgi:hypothetical protein